MKGSTYAGETLTVSDIVQYYYCPRKVYFLKVLGVPISVRRKMEYGKETHEKERRRLTEREQVYGFDREDVAEVLEGLQIEDVDLGLRGKVDVTLRLKNGEIVPVDAKLTDNVLVQRQHRKQLHAYALLLDNMFKTRVTKGIIYFAQQKKAVAIEISESDKAELRRDIQRIEKIITGEHLPRGASTEKCGYCETRQYCV
jgi:CRISPR-associated exonuclease Cas4